MERARSADETWERTVDTVRDDYAIIGSMEPENLDTQTLGRLLQAHRRPREKRCARTDCPHRFTTRGRGRYCSRACQQAAYRERKAAATPKDA
jgi:hypothetical protein